MLRSLDGFLRAASSPGGFKAGECLQACPSHQRGPLPAACSSCLLTPVSAPLGSVHSSLPGRPLRPGVVYAGLSSASRRMDPERGPLQDQKGLRAGVSGMQGPGFLDHSLELFVYLGLG